MSSLEKGKIIGEFDFTDYGLPTEKGYLLHQVSNGGNSGDKFPENREYLRIIGLDKNNEMIEYGYIYFILYKTEEGLSVSNYIGSKVMEDYRNKGLGDLLMSAYLFYSHDNGFDYMESTTRQRKLDLLSLMNKYSFNVKNPERYNNGERVSLAMNNMVVDIYKKNIGGIYYRFKTTKAEKLYRQRNAKVAENYNYLTSSTDSPEPTDIGDYKKLGWVVPNEEYKRTSNDDTLVKKYLNKSGFSCQ